MSRFEQMDIRSATPHDATAMAYIELCANFGRGVEDTEQQVHREALRIKNLLRLQTAWSRVIDTEDESIAFVFGYSRVNEGLPDDHHLDTIMVTPRHWRKGLGSLLIDAALGEALRQKATSLNLWTDVDNSPAQSLYRQKGFLTTSKTRVHPWRDVQQAEYVQHLPNLCEH